MDRPQRRNGGPARATARTLVAAVVLLAFFTVPAAGQEPCDGRDCPPPFEDPCVGTDCPPPPVCVGQPVITAPEVLTVAPGETITFTVTAIDPDGDAIRVFSYSGTIIGSSNDPVFTTNDEKTVGTFTWMATAERDEWTVFFRVVSCVSRACTCNGSKVTRIIVTDETPEVGSVSGRVAADCPAAGTGLYGVGVDAFVVGSGAPAASAVTDPQGNYTIPDLPAGTYSITILTPLGYSVTAEELQAQVEGGEDTQVNFDLACLSEAATPRTIGYWKHQVGVALGGRGHAQVDAFALCDYLDLIAEHFNSNSINEVAVYVPPASGECFDKLLVMHELLNLHGSVDMIDRARQQLTALLLNVASGLLSLTHVVTADGANVSQAITLCDNLIDDSSGDHELAKSIADAINNGETLPAGSIPLGTAIIAYRMSLLQFAAGPSPASGPRTFRLVLGRDAPVSLAVFDVAGRLVASVFEGDLAAGRHTLHWDGRTQDGIRPASGLYFARLTTATERRVVKLVEVAR